ncbi:MAG: sulfatase-like hydrolase/transferase [Acidobacteria bacterium]|nr:sulfatase-like hydrolase/transferase [Acidobacteriota bacterium]
MNRRDFLKTAGTTVSAVAASSMAGESTTRKPRQAVVILGESVRYDMLNCNKQTGVKTPNLDRIAREGVRFEKAYNCQPVCAPARSAVWTGIYPHTNGVWGNSMPLGDTTHSIGQRLTDRGVKCGFVGKWHLSGTDYFDTGKPAPGWDKEHWYDMRSYLNELSPEDRVRSRDPKTGLDGSWPAEKCYGRRCTKRAVDFLEKHKNEDFLLVVSYDEPHHPWLCPVEYTNMYKGFQFPHSENVNDPLTDKPEMQRIWSEGTSVAVQHPVNADQYFGSHTFIDAEIGTVLNKLDAVAPDALVMYTADHGIFLEAHRLIDKGPVTYEEITHIPFVARWKGTTPAGSVSKSLVSHIDIAGTLMEYFGHEVPKTLEGKSMLPLLKDPKAKVRDTVHFEFGRYEVDHDGFGGFQCLRGISDGRYKLSVNLLTTDEFYDLQTDPAEMHNLIDSKEHAAVRNKLHDQLLDHMNVTRDPFRGYYWGRRAWRPDFKCTWENAGYTRQRENDGYLPRELDYNTGLTMVEAQRPKV